MARRDVLPFDPSIAAGTLPVRARVATAPARVSVALLRFALPRPTAATVAVFAADGALLRSILGGELAAGEHACGWDGRDERDVPVPPGTYTVRVEASGRVLTSRRVVIG